MAALDRVAPNCPEHTVITKPKLKRSMSFIVGERREEIRFTGPAWRMGMPSGIEGYAKKKKDVRKKDGAWLRFNDTKKQRPRGVEQWLPCKFNLPGISKPVAISAFP